MAAIFFGIACGGISILLVNDCNNKRRNKKIPKKIKKEIKKLEMRILKKIRNIEDIELKNIMINSEIDEYKYKTDCHCRLFECGMELYDGPVSYQISGIWNDWNIYKYKFKDNLKRKLMSEEHYEELHDQKLKYISSLFENASWQQKEILFKHYEEYIVNSHYERNQRILNGRNEALENGVLRFSIPVEPETFGRRGPLGLF